MNHHAVWKLYNELSSLSQTKYKKSNGFDKGFFEVEFIRSNAKYTLSITFYDDDYDNHTVYIYDFTQNPSELLDFAKKVINGDILFSDIENRCLI